MPIKQGKIELTVGIFTVIGLVLLCILVFFVSDVIVFKKGYEVDTRFTYVSIIDKGAPVRMSGVRVGEVKNLAISYEEENQKPIVTLTLYVHNNVIIRKNSKIMIRGTTPLSEPHIEIMSQGLEDGVVLAPGGRIRGGGRIAMDDVVIVAEKAAENLEAVLAKVRKGEGTAGQLLVGDELYNELLSFIKDIKAHPWKLLARPKEKKKKFLGIF